MFNKSWSYVMKYKGQFMFFALFIFLLCLPVIGARCDRVRQDKVQKAQDNCKSKCAPFAVLVCNSDVIGCDGFDGGVIIKVKGE